MIKVKMLLGELEPEDFPLCSLPAQNLPPPALFPLPHVLRLRRSHGVLLIASGLLETS